MGMHISTSKGRGEPDAILDINTTPLIDVMLVLLVMLIITIPIQLHAVNLNLPVGTPPPALQKPEVVRIDIRPGAVMAWNGDPVPDMAALKGLLLQAGKQAVQPEVHVRPDKAAKYNDVAEVLVAINQAGLSKLGLVGSEQFVEQ
ncbi:MAG: biopolymer transporter ExbD [Burkholderiaceae bacterium]|nr:biopolymer transporter ExbD [Burkholderiaceae bacterium]